MHVKPFVPLRSTSILPDSPASMMRAPLAISGGPADSAMAIFCSFVLVSAPGPFSKGLCISATAIVPSAIASAGGVGRARKARKTHRDGMANPLSLKALPSQGGLDASGFEDPDHQTELGSRP